MYVQPVTVQERKKLMIKRLSRNFWPYEFECHGTHCCGHSAPIARILIVPLQLLRDKIKVPLNINSGYRCIIHNREEGSSDTSQHVLGLAADVRVPQNMTVDEFYEIADTISAFHGIGRYTWGLHVDVRDGVCKRWDKRP